MTMQPTDKELAEARELLAAAEGVPAEWVNHEWKGAMCRQSVAIDAIVAALRTARQARDGEVVVTRDEAGEIVMVSRQNDDGEVMEVIASTCHAGDKATQQQAGQAVACNVEGSWLWGKLMDWCKAQGIAPGTQDALFRIASEAHQQYTTPQTHDGYVLVPREPTEAMIEASMIAIPIAKRIPAGSTFRVYGARAWEAMIAASEASGGE